MREFLQYVVTQLVDDPNEVSLDEHSDDKAFRFRLEVPAPEVGKIIGRGGHTIGAIRNLMANSAAKQNKRVFVEVSEKG